MNRLLVVAAMALAAPVAAQAHAMLDHASPAVGSTGAAPKTLTLWFTEALEPAFSGVEVHNAQGADVAAGKATVDVKNRAQLGVPLKALAPGVYKVNWHVLSVDTHRTEGSFTFTVNP